MSSAQPTQRAHPDQPSARDVRVDFFRGVALLFIFVDHIPGNFLAWFTLHNFGFSDAAEMFVGLAGYGAYFAYTKPFERKGFRAGMMKIGERIRDLYLSHVLVLVVCMLALALAAWLLYDPSFFFNESLAAFRNDPGGAVWRALMLVSQPGYHDILPLYIVLLAWFPVLTWLLQRHVLLALAASITLWLVAWQWNLPTSNRAEGWVFNPLAWQLLFSLGVITAYLRNEAWRVRSNVVFALAAAYVVFAFFVVAPWTRIPGLAEANLLPTDLILPIDKRNLSLWRVAHFAALTYIAAILIPQNARWLSRPWAQRFIDCGSHSLPVFCMGTILSLLGYVVVVAMGRSLFAQIIVTAVGIGLLGALGWKLAQWKSEKTSPEPASSSASLRPSPP